MIIYEKIYHEKYFKEKVKISNKEEISNQKVLRESKAKRPPRGEQRNCHLDTYGRKPIIFSENGVLHRQ